MEIVAQLDDLVFVTTKMEGVFPSGFVVDTVNLKLMSEEIHLFSVLKHGDWEVPNISKQKEKEILHLVKMKQG